MHHRGSAERKRSTFDIPSDAHHADDSQAPVVVPPDSFFSRRPAIRAVLICILGIVLGEYSDLPVGFIYLFAVGMFITFVVLSLWTKYRLPSDMILLAALFFAVSASHKSQRESAVLETLIVDPEGEPVEVVGTLSSQPVWKESGCSFLLEPDSLFLRPRWRSDVPQVLIQLRASRDSLGSSRLAVGSSISLKGNLLRFPFARNPGEFDYGRYLRMTGIRGIIRVGKTDRWEFREGQEETSFRTTLSEVQTDVFSLFDRLHTEEHSAFLKGVVWGFRADIPEEIKQSFLDTGTIHILAVSGSNVAVVALALAAMLGLIRLNGRWLAGATMLGLIAYMLITGSSPSVVRATIMGLVVLLSTQIERKTEIYNSMAFAALLLMMADSNTLFDPGFLLSFSAVLSLVYFYPPLERIVLSLTERYEKLAFMNPALRLFAVSLAAQVGTLPYTATTFGRVSLISVFANLVVVPVSGLNVLIGSAEAVAATISDVLAFPFAEVNDLLVWLLLGFVRAAAAVPYATIVAAEWSMGGMLLYYLASGIVVHIRDARMMKLLMFVLLVAANIVTVSALLASPQQLLRLTILDVGQGDAILVESPSNERFLIDTGPSSMRSNAGERVILPYLQRLGISTLEKLAITHFHDDHSGGLETVLDGIRIEEFIHSKETMIPLPIQARISAQESLGMKVRIVNMGDVVSLASDLRCYVFAPGPNLSEEKNKNAHSLVFKIVYGQTSILLTGDFEEAGEQFSLKQYGDCLRSDILKVGHHGSTSSSSAEFLSAVKPCVALISVGTGNKFAHPSPIIIERLRGAGMQILRTDHAGAIEFTSDGAKWTQVK